ncbi:MAG: hypothetical protein AMXMBFR84_27030 [Candidatus Hydrogenedentota bacterium]
MKSGDRVARIPSANAPVSPRFEPDGESILFFDSVGAINLFDIKTQTVKPMLFDRAAECVFPGWSPNAESVLYYQRPRDRVPDPSVHLYQLDMASLQTERLTDDAGVMDITPVWSPDGKRILFRRMSGFGPRQTRAACILEVVTEKVTPLCPDDPGDAVVSRFHWSPDGSHVIAMKTQRAQGTPPGTLKLVRVDDAKVIWDIEESGLEDAAFLSSGRILGITDEGFCWIDAADGAIGNRFAFAETGSCRRDVNGPVLGIDGDDVLFLSDKRSIYRVTPGGSSSVVLDPEAEPLPVCEQSEYRVASDDGFSVPVKRFTPPNAKPLAVMVVIGGPGAPIDPDMDPIIGVLIEAGYEVAVPAYRGCNGYGPEHLAAGRGEWGNADVLDVVAAGNDWKQRSERPLAVVGYSYGGYLTLLALARDDAPWLGGATLWGMLSLQPPLLSMIEATVPAESIKAVIAARSPLAQASHIDRPLLLLHGALDGGATTEEAMSLAKAIAHAQLHVYKNDAHGLSLNRGDVIHRLTAFLVGPPLTP